MKLDWKKTDKAFYLPGTEPELVTVPAFKFFAVRGAGDPNEPGFQDHVAVLYSLAYAVRMSPKSGAAPEGYPRKPRPGGIRGLPRATMSST